jgi:hypothetical protein
VEDKKMNWYNSALIQDEILVHISRVIDYGDPAGPAFLNSIGTLVEAIVLHENVYFDPARGSQVRRSDNRTPDGRETVASIIYGSSFVQHLIRDGVLKPLPGHEDLNTYLESKGANYNYWEFISDLMWRLMSFASTDPEEQRRLYVSQAFLMDKFPKIFHSKDLIDDFEPGDEPEFLEVSAQVLYRSGVPIENLLQWEGWNHIGSAYADLARSLGLHLYLVDLALPNQLGAIRQINLKAREIYEVIKSKLDEVDDENIGTSDFQSLQIPPLFQIVLANCKDSRNALAEEVFNLRYRHRKFRHYLTNYEAEWDTAKTRNDRFRLKREFENAWKTLAVKEDRASTRLIYTLWDIFKSPTKIFEKIGDKLADKGKEISVIEQARGLHDFWNELQRSPVSNQNQELLRNLFPKQVEEKVWIAAKEFSNSTAAYLKQFK